jgi:mono/diheme cytochrome c family protein
MEGNFRSSNGINESNSISDEAYLKSRLLSVFYLSLFAASAAVAQSSTKPLTDNPIYQNNCAKCHGKTAEGRFMGGPSLVSADATAMSADDLRNIITNGKHRMPKYAGKLKPEEIDTLVDQIKSGHPR